MGSVANLEAPGAARTASTTPVVLIVFDELPLLSLLGADRYSHIHDALGYALVNTVALDHADYFASTQAGELPAVDLDEEEHQFLDSYLTGGW